MQLQQYNLDLTVQEFTIGLETRNIATTEIVRDADDVGTAIQGHSRSSVVVPISIHSMVT